MEAFSLSELVSVAHCSELTTTQDKDEISSQISAQLFDLCDHDLFPDQTLQNSDEVTSSSNCCYEENSSYHQNHSLLDPFTPYQTNNPTNTNTLSTNAENRIPIIFETQNGIENDISASIDFSQQNPFGAQPQPQPSLVDSVGIESSSADSFLPIVPNGGSVPSIFNDDCLSSMPSFLPVNPPAFSCSFLGPNMGSYLPADASAGFSTALLMAAELQPQDLDFQGDSAGIYCPDSMQGVFNPAELQTIGNESQQMMVGAGNQNTLAADIPNIGDQTFKVGKLSVEQRKEKIHRYMKKRNERNFSKKIKYACRKTLADSRPRVRGRFAKNDDFGESQRAASSNHEEDDEEVVVKEEDDMVDSSDIFAHISGVNSFKCNYSIQSWI